MARLKTASPRCLFSLGVNKNLDIYTSDEIERFLSNPQWQVRKSAANLYLPLTDVQIQQGLMDSDWRVRLAFVSRKDLWLSDSQIEVGLADENWHVRSIFQQRASGVFERDMLAKLLPPKPLTFSGQAARPL
jgi:hypothetical protein